MPFYYQRGNRILEEGGEENSLCEGEVVSVNGGTVESSNRYGGDGHDDGDLGW